MGSGRYFGITAARGIEEMASLVDAQVAWQAGGYIWLDFSDPSREELTAVAAPLGLHPLAVEDCLDEDQVPKIDDFPGHTFILFNRFRPDDGGAAIDEVNFFLAKNLLVSVHSHGRADTDFAEHLVAVVRRELQDVQRGPDFLLAVILDDIVDGKFTVVEALQDRLDAIEENILSGAADFRPLDLIGLRRALLLLRKSLVYEREILVKVCRRDSPYVSEPAIYQFRDIYDHLSKFFEAIEICRELIASIMEIHLSMLNNQIAIVGNKTNQVVRRLTLITTVFMPLTLLAGIGGMSEYSMMTGPHNWRVAYPLFLVVLAIIALVNYYVLRLADARDRAEYDRGRLFLP
jgi:magnesium transporter